jgi:flavin reductase (DIM6/NTAB) family NADH-FMN oxidoreductase RutF
VSSRERTPHALTTADQAQFASPPPADDEGLRRAFRRHAGSVSVVTASHHGSPVGLLVTSLVSVSAGPPLTSFNVSLTSSSWPALERARHIGLHLLAEGQETLATLFAQKGADRFSPPTVWQAGPYHVPLLEGCASWSVACIEQRVPAGDHMIVVARLLHTDTREEAAPLLYHAGAYHRAVPTIARPAGEQPCAPRLSVVADGNGSR